MKSRDRYFVIDWHVGKGGHWKHHTYERGTHESATALACVMVLSLLDDAGSVPDTERFEVFVGSKTALDKRLSNHE